MHTELLAREGQYLTFRVAEDEYGIPILKVREIIEYTSVTRIPNMPEVVRGIINLRGNVVPVVDLARRFNLASAPVTRWTCIVVVEVSQEGGTNVLGIMADAVSQVVDLTDNDLEPPPDLGLDGRLDYLLGMGKQDSHFVLLLDIDRVLSLRELMALREGVAQAESPDEEE